MEAYDNTIIKVGQEGPKPSYFGLTYFVIVILTAMLSHIERVLKQCCLTLNGMQHMCVLVPFYMSGNIQFSVRRKKEETRVHSYSLPNQGHILKNFTFSKWT